MRTIVKVQVPLATNDSDPKALIYNKNRSFETFVPVAEVKKKMSGEFKKFFYCDIDIVTKKVKLDAPAPLQDW